MAARFVLIRISRSRQFTQKIIYPLPMSCILFSTIQCSFLVIMIKSGILLIKRKSAVVVVKYVVGKCYSEYLIISYIDIYLKLFYMFLILFSKKANFFIFSNCFKIMHLVYLFNEIFNRVFKYKMNSLMANRR